LRLVLVQKIRSGIYGLNGILDGGLNRNSTTVVIGGSGAGKTTMATQFIRRGLESGQEAIFISLDENKEQIIKEAVEMGWGEILNYLEDEKLVFIDASGREFSKFIKSELPAFVKEWKGANSRIVIDPLTPVMWSTKDAYEQRELIGFMFKQTRKVGTVLCTLEEHGTAGDLSGPETIIPMYLADTVLHLRYSVMNEESRRFIKVIKARSTRHSQREHPYSIIKGLGMVIENGEEGVGGGKKATRAFRALLKENRSRIPVHAYQRIMKATEEMSDEDFQAISPAELVTEIVREYAEDAKKRTGKGV
jgi:KaiC/GvpD/RAD55 family RecA-like ATPase